MTWVLVPFLAGSSDRIFVSFDIPYQRQIEVLRVVWWLLPPVVFLLTLSTCRRLRASGVRPLRVWTGQVVTRRRDGGFRDRDRAPGG